VSRNFHEDAYKLVHITGGIIEFYL